MGAPKYQQPQLDPQFGVLADATKQQDIAAVNTGMMREESSLTARYGALTSGDKAWLLARYGTQLALAGQGGGSLASGLRMA